MTVWLGDYDVSRMTARVPYPYGESDAEAFIAAGEPHRFVIEHKQAGVFLGMAGLLADESCEFGYWLGKPFWGRATPPKLRGGWRNTRSKCWTWRTSMPAGSTTTPPRAMSWPSWARAITVRSSGIAAPGAPRSSAMTCC